MLFNSLVFVIFALLFFSMFWLVKRRSRTLTWAYIVFFSFIFYGWWDWRFIFLILGSGLIDFFAGRAIYRHPRYRKLFLTLSLLGNLGSLAAFKYSRFLFGQLETLLSRFDIHVELTRNLPEFLYILPVGISFYTFQSMSYTIDVYKGELKPTRNILKFFAYLSMFPQLVAGPIVRARNLLPQLDRLKRPTEVERWHGMKLIASGYFKKILLADNIAPLVNTAFADIHRTNSTLYWWIVMTGFAFQIYLDFSGYTDIARGLAKWMGFRFKMNFNHPYLSTSFREFWRRWHISLSTWFRDYVYIPLGGSRQGKVRSHANMWVTMVVSGFWHGASWNFLVWGWLHALYLSFERITRWPALLKRYRLAWVAVLFVMFQTVIAWVFFRAQSLPDAFTILHNMLWINPNLDFTITADVKNGIYFLVFALLIEYLFMKIKLKRILRNEQALRIAEVVLLAVMISVTIFLRGKGHAFIYFQF